MTQNQFYPPLILTVCLTKISRNAIFPCRRVSESVFNPLNVVFVLVSSEHNNVKSRACTSLTYLTSLMYLTEPNCVQSISNVAYEITSIYVRNTEKSQIVK